MEKDRTCLLNFIVESWRFSNVFNQIISKLADDERKRYISRLDWYKKQMSTVLQQYGYKFVDVSGESYNSGMALTPLNVDEFSEEDRLVVEYMMEPIIMDRSGNIVKTGTAILRRESL